MRLETKKYFAGINVVVMALQVLAAMALLFGGVSAVYMMLTGIGNLFYFITMSFGGIAAAFLIFAIAEFLELLLQIELNTRKTERVLENAISPTTKTRRPARKR